MIEFIRQRKIIIWASVFLLGLLSLLVLQPFLVSLTIGFTFAVALVPIRNFFSKRFKLRQNTAAAVVSTLTTFVIIGPVVFVIYKLISYLNKNEKLVSDAEEVENKFFSLIYTISQQVGLKITKMDLFAALSHITGSVQEFFITAGKTTAASIPDITVQMVIMFFTLFVVLINYKRFTFKTLDAVGISSEVITRINLIVFEVCRDVVFANILTGFVQASMVTVGAMIFTSTDPVLIFVITFVVSFVPIIGAAPVAVALGFLQFADRQPSQAIALILVAVVVGLSDNIIRAKLMGRHDGDTAFLNFLASIGGIYLWGLSGIFMGPLVVALTIRTVPLLLSELTPAAVVPRETGEMPQADASSTSNSI